ncbi:MAG: hypothetical protein J6A51_02305 [Clostridia bacterium]|nr:hypothetical protein [Clostridia bacterium]
MLENYHYAGLLIAVASLAKNIDLKHEIIGTGISRTTIYNVQSTDSHDVNFNLNLNTYQTHETELQEKLYQLVEYVKNTSSKGKKVQISNDETMFKCVVDLANAHNERLEYLLSKTTDSELQKTVKPMIDKITQIQTKRQEIETNFLPYTREHIAYFIAENIAFRAYASRETVLISELKTIINESLKKFGCTDESINEMYAQNKPLKKFEQPPQKQ